MAIYVDTMSLIGWVGSVEEKADYLLSCFLTCNRSQTVLFGGNITSLQYLLKLHGGDNLTLERELRRVLEEKFDRVFNEGSVVLVTVEDRTENPGFMTIRFSCTVTVDGREYSFGKLVQFMNSRLQRIANLTNGITT